MAQYRSELEDQIRDNHSTKHPTRSTTTAAKIENEPDTQAVISLVNNVDQAVSKKKNGNESNVTLEVAKPETIRAVAQQIEVESMNSDQLIVHDKVPNRSQEDTAALVRGMQTFAAQENRKVYLRIGTETKIITPTTTFARPNP
jgi:hypothetical protein